MPRRLTNYEQETTINFNKAEDTAYIFTYEKAWQKHLEKKLGLKPTLINGFGGRGYEIEKNESQCREYQEDYPLRQNVNWQNDWREFARSPF